MKWNMKWYIFEKIRCVLVDVFWTKTCFLVHVTRGKRKRKKEEKILIWTMVFKEKKASVKGLIGIPWAFSGLCSSNSSPSQRGAAGTKEALSLATSLQLAQTCIGSVMCSSASMDLWGKGAILPLNKQNELLLSTRVVLRIWINMWISLATTVWFTPKNYRKTSHTYISNWWSRG